MSAAEESTEMDNNGSYIHLYLLLRTNRSFRLYLLSETITQWGEWFTYVACITMIKRILHDDDEDGQDNDNEETKYGKAISLLVVLRTMPSICLSALGGTLADSYDRRKSLIYLNTLGGLVALAFVLAYASHSIVVLYIMVAIQQSLAALIGPSIGASSGGFFIAHAGIPLCFVVDSISFFLSAFIMYLVPGSFDVSSSGSGKDTERTMYKSLGDQVVGMTKEVTHYIRSSSIGGILLFKASGASLVGAGNVLNVPLSEIPQDGDGWRRAIDTMFSSTEQRLGLLYAAFGVGCILGPVLHDGVMGHDLSPAQMQRACVIGLWSMALSYLGIGFFSTNFLIVLSCSVIRAMGTAVVHIHSSVIIQRFTAHHLLGRVLAFETALFFVTESGSAVLCGYLQDNTTTLFSQPSFISLLFAILGGFLSVGWTVFHLAGYGTANQRIDYANTSALSDVTDNGDDDRNNVELTDTAADVDIGTDDTATSNAEAEDDDDDENKSTQTLLSKEE